MAKFIKRNAANGRYEEESGVTVSAGAGDVGKFPQFDATGKLDASVLPSGIGAETEAAVATEALAAGDLVNTFDNAGTKGVRKANGSSPGLEATGYVLAAFAAAATATVFTDGANTARTGLTAGATYYLGATAGSITLTPLSTAGQIHQRVGKASSATSLVFEHFDAITLA
jgi:hypothetical protein